jgi:hypothetical protein
MKIVIGLAAVVPILGIATVQLSPNKNTPQKLEHISASDARAITGGVAADITYPAANNTAQTYDNLRFAADITSAFIGEPTYVSIWADSTKVGSETMNFNAITPQELDRRTMWPFPGNRDAQFKYYAEGQYFEADGDSTRLDQRLHSSVKLRAIHFWNVRQGASNPSVSSGFHAARVDASDPSRTATSPNIDGVFGQCGGNDKTQFRGDGTTNYTPTYDPPGAYNCSDLGAIVTNLCSVPQICGSANYASCPQLLSCLNDLAGAAIARDSTTGYIAAHVFNVESTLCGELGRSFGISAGGVSRSIAIMHAGLGSDAAGYTKTLAHELTHDVLGHCQENDGCSAADCVSGDSSENLMCSNGPGRDLTTDQCNDIKTFRWTDRN